MDKLQTKFCLENDYRTFQGLSDVNKDTLVEIVNKRSELKPTVTGLLETIDIINAPRIPADLKWYARQQVNDILNEWNKEYEDQDKTVVKNIILEMLTHEAEKE